MSLQVIHPFPARMAPEVAWGPILDLRRGSTVLDPMCGSGVVLRAAAEAGVQSYGFDLDPLAVLISGAWTSTAPRSQLLHDAHIALERAAELMDLGDRLPWHDDETYEFVQYWFGPRQRLELASLARSILESRSRNKGLLRTALSRIVITKDRGASLARDVSHSRPHKVWQESDYDVYAGFLRSARQLAKNMNSDRVKAKALVRRGDSRKLCRVPDSSIDCVVTSPPYLNAIDYLRGHRLSLVWLGFGLSGLRNVRGASVGSERSPDGDIGSHFDLDRYVTPCVDQLPRRQRGWLYRYCDDAERISSEIARVTRGGGTVVLVVGNSFIRGQRIDNATIFADALTAAGLDNVERREREIPARRRYLPIPHEESGLGARMRSEVVLRSING
jgi:SAM-dependent methyltransferase